MRNQLLPALLALTVAGCATTGGGKPYVYDEKHSRAWNIARAAGLRLKDVELPEKAQRIDGGSGPGLVSTAAFTGANYLSPPPGFSAGGAAAMGFLSFLLDTGHKPREAVSRVIIWIPRERAAAREEAADAAFDLVKQALAELVTEKAIFPEHEVTFLEEKYYNYRNGSRLARFQIKGPGCEPPRKCGVSIWVNRRAAVEKRDVVATTAPEFLGGYPAWLVHVLVGAGACEGNTCYAVLPELEMLVKLSERLPESAYIYVGPKDVSYYRRPGDAAFLTYPLVLDHGNILYFVKPRG